tara:strand:+ start:446 stop:973 length:528 start_codon:yes stop_codon:yes gene_type:complete
MGALTKEEIKKIMKDPNSPERKIYDKMIKGNPLFPDLDKVDKPKKQTKPKKRNKVLDKADKLIKNANKTGEPYVISPANQPSLKQGKMMKKAMKDDAKNKKTGAPHLKRTSTYKFNKGGMPDFSGDGKITKKDVLIGRGVIKKKAGGSIKAKKMNKCRMDGIAIRGKTRAKQRSK